MKKIWLLLAMITPLQLIHAQEVQHASTVEQCRADQRLWLSKLEDDAGIANVSYIELGDWTAEMIDCRKVDLEFHSQYYNTASEADVTRLLRVRKFLDRHNLTGQFLAEDAQGKGR